MWSEGPAILDAYVHQATVTNVLEAGAEVSASNLPLLLGLHLHGDFVCLLAREEFCFPGFLVFWVFVCFFFLNFREKEREHTNWGERGRGKGRENLKQTPHLVQSLMWGSIQDSEIMT